MKVAIIGAGNVGASAAVLLLTKKIANKISLVDIDKNLAMGKALDLNHLCCVLNLDAKVKASNDYQIIKNADICVITAGLARKEGQSRDDLLKNNANIIINASKQIAKFAPNTIIIVVSNPVDAMVFATFKASKFKDNQVFGMSGELDSARLIFELAKTYKVKPKFINACIMGEHGQNMIATKAQIFGKDLTNKTLIDFENKTKNAGAQIISLLGTSAYFAPAAGIVKMCEAIKKRNGKILICSAISKDNIPCGKYVKFSKQIKIIEPKIRLKKAKNAIKENCIKIQSLMEENNL